MRGRGDQGAHGFFHSHDVFHRQLIGVLLCVIREPADQGV
jgi:hypothetical protein